LPPNRKTIPAEMCSGYSQPFVVDTGFRIWCSTVNLDVYMRIAVAIILTTLCASVGYASARAWQDETAIGAIRREYAAINKGVSRYRKVKKDLSGFSLEGGEMTAYFRGPQIVKIVAIHYGEGGRTLEEYYYRNGQLIFVFEKVLNYDRPLSGKVVSTTENRFYYNDGELIRWIDATGKPVAVDAEYYSVKQNELLSNSTTYVTAARSKSKILRAITP
jgi:hypothetical protein